MRGRVGKDGIFCHSFEMGRELLSKTRIRKKTCIKNPCTSEQPSINLRSLVSDTVHTGTSLLISLVYPAEIKI